MRTLRVVTALLAAGVLAAAGGCSRPAGPDPQRSLAVCVGPTADRPAGRPVKIEFRQAGTVVASASIQVGGVFEAPVPAAADIEVYADGTLLGSGGAAYLRGEGCPATPAG